MARPRDVADLCKRVLPGCQFFQRAYYTRDSIVVPFRHLQVRG